MGATDGTERAQPQQAFLFVGNQLCLDFINTEMIIRGHRMDLLAGWPDLMRWAVQAKLLSATEARKVAAGRGAAEEARMLHNAKAFRAVLREMAEQIVAGKPVPERAINVINRLLSQRPGYPQLRRTGGRLERWFHAESHGAAQWLVPLAEAASDLLCTGDLAFVKKCQHDACILYFYDTTKNHTRQWCSMGLCGNRVKAAAHYRRKKKGG